MQFQFRADNHIKASAALSESIRADVEAAVHPHFNQQLRKIDVYVQDVNGDKGGIDIRCNIEAHLSGHQPVVVHNMATNVEESVGGAVEKLIHALEKTLGRLKDGHGRVSMSGEST